MVVIHRIECVIMTSERSQSPSGTFDFTHFLNQVNSHNSQSSKMVDIEDISLVTIKLMKSTIQHMKNLTTEGMNSDERLKFVRSITNGMNGDIFEFSTCNRVLYVGFGVSCQEIIDKVLEVANLNYVPFQTYRGMDVWRHLVNVCSGLDSFILGELQVMGQFRGALSWHRKNNLISDMNAVFFDHVVAANRVVRKELGFTKTPESMFSLANNAIMETIAEVPDATITVIGFGDMGIKAVKALFELKQENILVITRTGSEASKRAPEISTRVRFKTFDEWAVEDKTQIIISTIRNIKPTFNSERKIPVTNKTKILDFSWPPSIDPSGIHANQELLDVKHWIRVAHKLEIDWNYDETINSGNMIIQDIEERFVISLRDKTQAEFRAFIYARMDELSTAWEDLDCDDLESSQMRPFSREIATWICKQEGKFNQEDLYEEVIRTRRKIRRPILTHIATDVTREMIRINDSETLLEAAH
ncbi:MAG: hypothetical protein CMB47_01885 [Euryarchaeota archaeon]|nr:hypothetical protein [Euryarchaeota archaeon]